LKLPASETEAWRHSASLFAKKAISFSDKKVSFWQKSQFMPTPREIN
jgi:hypothetical protein